MESKINLRGSELEESFSFSSYDFNSTIGLFSDDDDDNGDAYIEIALETAPESPPTPTHEEGKAGDDDQELEFSMSFSSVVSFPGFSCSSTPGVCKNMAPCSGSGGADVSSSPPARSELLSDHGINKRRVKFPVMLNRLVNLFPSSTLKGSSSSSGIGDENGRPRDDRQWVTRKGNWERVRSRTTASKVITTMNSCVIKFLVKFRSPIISIRPLLASLRRQVKSPGGNSTTQHNQRRSDQVILRSYQRLIKSFNKWLLQSRNLEAESTNGHIDNSRSGNGDKSRVLEINLDASMNVAGNAKQIVKSCSNSIKSSPIHQGVLSESNIYFSRENSVQAAIAHCKKSFGQTYG